MKYYRPGDIVYVGPDYDIIAELGKNGKLTFVVCWRNGRRSP